MRLSPDGDHFTGRNRWSPSALTAFRKLVDAGKWRKGFS